jgi:hypothetical protein
MSILLVTVAEMSVARGYVSSIGTLLRTFHTAINNAGQIVGRVNMSLRAMIGMATFGMAPPLPATEH